MCDFYKRLSAGERVSEALAHAESYVRGLDRRGRRTAYEALCAELGAPADVADGPRDIGGVLVAVWDASPEIPQPKPVRQLTLDDLEVSDGSFDDNGGRGLPLVQALSHACGVTKDPKGGKWIWARLNP